MIYALIAIIVLLLLIVLRVPIAFAMGAVGVAGMMVLSGTRPALALVAQVFSDVATTSSLAVLPLFVLMGALVTRSGMSQDLYAAANALLGHRRGGLAMATVLACAGFSSICGSSLATAATMAKVALPPMRSFRYSDRLAVGSIAAGGTLGILIPPSIILVLYGTITETSIGKLFIAAILPGLVGVVFYLGAVAIMTTANPASGPAGPYVPIRDRLRALSKVWGILLLFIVVIGGIYLGVFTPTEAAGIGAAASFILVFVHARLQIREMWSCLVETAEVSAMLFFVLIGALVFANFINNTGLPGDLTRFVVSLGVEATFVLLLILAVYLVLGCFLESISMVLLTVPIFLPLITELGFDPIWFGIVVVVATEIGLITPPVGMNLFVIRSVIQDLSTGDIIRGVTPFLVVDIARLALIAFVPALSLLLPSLM